MKLATMSNWLTPPCPSKLSTVCLPPFTVALVLTKATGSIQVGTNDAETNIPVFLSSATSTGLYVYTRQIANQSFTVTPQGADVVFTPASANLGPNNQATYFSFNASSPGEKVIFFYIL